jgi:hypothetical protein
MVEHPPTIADTAQIDADLVESEADIAAGRMVPLEAVLDRVRQSITRMEARRAARERQTAQA